MITDAVLGVVGSIISFIGGLLPEASDVLPAGIESFGADLAERAAPMNKFLPLEELFSQAQIIFAVWLPAVLVYQVVFWVYKHLPVIGKG